MTQFRMMSDGGATLLGTVSDVEVSVPSTTPTHLFALCLSGTTAQRPRQGDPGVLGGVPLGQFYIDTTLNQVVVADGQGGWRSPLTGALV